MVWAQFNLSHSVPDSLVDIGQTVHMRKLRSNSTDAVDFLSLCSIQLITLSLNLSSAPPQ